MSHGFPFHFKGGPRPTLEMITTKHLDTAPVCIASLPSMPGFGAGAVMAATGHRLSS